MAGRETGRLPDLFRLPEMTSIVRRNHEQSCRDAEPGDYAGGSGRQTEHR
jgi:hypothetical protein